MNKKRLKTRLFRWQKGRQNTGYDKMLLGFGIWPRPFDIYILRFTEGQEIPPHFDPVQNGAHYRLNIILKTATIGGEFICTTAIYESSRIKYFRPDISEHAVTTIIKGSRYVLSFGWIKTINHSS